MEAEREANEDDGGEEQEEQEEEPTPKPPPQKDAHALKNPRTSKSTRPLQMHILLKYAAVLSPGKLSWLFKYNRITFVSLLTQLNMHWFIDLPEPKSHYVSHPHPQKQVTNQNAICHCFLWYEHSFI